MRIVILADPLDNQRAGIHYYTQNLIRELGQIDKEDEYYIIRRKKDDLFPAGRQIVVRNHRFPGYAALRMFYLIPRRIRKLDADIVVEPAHFGPFNLPKKIKRVTVIHDLTPILFPKLHRFHSQLLQRIFLKSILRRAALIITNSENTARDVKDFIPSASDRTISIYLGKDESIKYTKISFDEFKELRGKDYFLFTGTIEPRKNLECLLDAFKIYKDQSRSEQMLVIAGQQGWKIKSFFNRLKDHPYRKDIFLTGFVPREVMSSMYSNATSFIFPSLYEGFGLPVVEAMACGTPCLISDTSSLPEVGGDAALYFKPGEAETLAALMQKIVSDPQGRKELSEKAIQQAEKFSWRSHALSFDKAIKKLYHS